MTALFDFTLGKGIGPNGLVLGKNGNPYGTTYHGGEKCGRNESCGTVFELIPPDSPGGAWKERTVHKFAGKASQDGGKPEGGLFVGPDGTNYGTTSEGGKGNGGTLFQIKP